MGRVFRVGIFLLGIISSSLGQSATQGQWSTLENWPSRAIHTTLLPDGRVFFFSYYSESMQPHIWKPSDDTFMATASAPYALFCAGHASMADGRIFIAGGHIADYTGYAHALIYDPFQNTFTPTPDMNNGRWYPTVTGLPNGDLLVISGDTNSNTAVNPLPQVFQVSTGQWRDLTNAQLMTALYPNMFVAPNGKVFMAGPSRLSRYLDTTGAGSWQSVANMNFTAVRDYGPGLMYDTGKILMVGGGQPPTATAEVIDLNSATPAWTFTGSMHFARRQHNAVILPDGKVLIVGGSSGNAFDDSASAVLPTEMWDPATGQFTVMASIATYRGYHSTALLLPDGRVLSAGGNVGGPNAQVYSPPYLFAGARPTISSAPSSVGYGQTVFISTPDAAGITQVTFIKTSSTTHTNDQGQRFMRLNFTKVSGGVNVIFPAQPNNAPPGYYLLFLLNSAGVPSVGSIIQITQSGTATGNISGLVTNSAGAPLQGASVSAGGVKATTAADGSYTLANVAAGATTITAALSGYQNVSESATVVAGTQDNAATLVLAPLNPGNLTGKVTDTNANPIQGATVTGAGVSIATDSTGTYALNNLPSGTVTLMASAPGFQPGSEAATVAANTTSTAPTISLAQSVGNVTGKITDSLTGAAVSGASISFGGGSTTSDANGNYLFQGVPAGTIQLVASASGYQNLTQDVIVNGNATTTSNFNLLRAAVTFIPITPCRVVDTRNPNGPFGGPFLAANASRSFAIPNSGCNVPATAQAYSLNYTVVPKVKLAYLTTYPCGQGVPLVSTLNSDGRIKAAAAITPAGANAAVCVFASDDTDLVIDINGYFVPSGSSTAGLAFYPVAPCRVVDTRLAAGPLGGPSLAANATRTFPVLSSSCNLPASAQAYSLNFTSVPKPQLAFLTTWPAGQPQPLVSTLNSKGPVTANAAIVPAGTNGDISVYVTDASDLVIDVNGYFAPPGTGGFSFFPLPPCRVLDTRIPAGSPPFTDTRAVNVAAANCSASASAQAYVLNATVVPPAPLDYLTMWSGVGSPPLVSTLNASDAAITSNMAIVPAKNGSVGAYAPQSTHLVLDISGYFGLDSTTPTTAAKTTR